MFNEEELQSLIRGRGAAGIDIDELRDNVNYAGGYHDGHPTIQAFWEVILRLPAARALPFLIQNLSQGLRTRLRLRTLIGFRTPSWSECSQQASQ